MGILTHRRVLGTLAQSILFWLPQSSSVMWGGNFARNPIGGDFDFSILDREFITFVGVYWFRECFGGSAHSHGIQLRLIINWMLCTSRRDLLAANVDLVYSNDGVGATWNHFRRVISGDDSLWLLALISAKWFVFNQFAMMRMGSGDESACWHSRLSQDYLLFI